ncbi:MAG: hypothetical protein ACRD21_05085 [Vicinamibacteria bacterium]
MANVPVPPQEQKKGLSPLAWIAIGCLGILVLGGVVATLLGMFVVNKVGQYAQEFEDDPVAVLAKGLAAGNPEIELVEADKENRIVTFRNVKTGEELTVNYDDIEQGKLSFSSDGKEAEFQLETTGEEAGQLTIRSDEGTATFSAGADATDIPDWVPLYPGSAPKGNFATEGGGQRSGAFSFEADSDLESILDFYEGEKDRSGLEVRSRTAANEEAILVMSSTDESRGLNIMASRKGSSSEVAVTFTEKR